MMTEGDVLELVHVRGITVELIDLPVIDFNRQKMIVWRRSDNTIFRTYEFTVTPRMDYQKIYDDLLSLREDMLWEL